MGDEEAAVDAMQDAFVQVLRRREHLHDAAPSSLLYRIATNVCLNLLRKRKTTPMNAEDSIIQQIAGTDNPEKLALTNHFTDRIFSNQRENTRAIATYHYVDGMTLEETAELVGMSVSGIRKRLRFLRERGLALREV